MTNVSAREWSAGGAELFLRLTVTDVHGNLAEERVRVVSDSTAAPPTCD